jgi:hypothetical protein
MFLNSQTALIYSLSKVVLKLTDNQHFQLGNENVS